MPDRITRRDIRKEVVDRFYTGKIFRRGTCQSSTTTTITDTALAWGMIRKNDFVDAWVWINGGMSLITQFDPTAGTLTFSPAIAGLTGAQDYEIHYAVAPDEVNSIIDRVVTSLTDEQYVPVTAVENGDVQPESAFSTSAVFAPAATLTNTIIAGDLTLTYTSTGDPIVIGDVIRIDTEDMYVTNVDTTTNLLTITRGANGTTPAGHNAGSSIFDVGQKQWLAFGGLGNPVFNREDSSSITGPSGHSWGFGRYHLDLNIFAAAGMGIQSANIPVTPGSGVFIATGIRFYQSNSTPNDQSVEFSLYDTTNSAKIKTVLVTMLEGSSVGADPGRLFEIKFNAAIPTNCDEVQLRYEAPVGTSGLVHVFVQYAILTHENERRYQLPFYVRSGAHVLGAYRMVNPSAGGSSPPEVYIGHAAKLEPIPYTVEESGARLGRPIIVFPGNEVYNYPCWVKILRNETPLVDDNDWVYYDKNLIASGVMYYLYKRMGDTVRAAECRRDFLALNSRRGVPTARIVEHPIEHILLAGK